MNAGATRRWGRVLPVVFVTYSLAYLDRANFGMAAAAGMARDLRLTPGMLSAIGAFFSFGYFLFQMPGAIYAQRRSVKRLVFASLILWGACAALTGIVRDTHWLLAVRFALGMIEAAVFPALLLYLARWFPRSERSRANTLVIIAIPITVIWMSVISGYLIRALDWRWMFILEGVPSIAWAFGWWCLAAERPTDAAWLSAADKGSLSATFEAEQGGVRPVASYRAAFRTPAVILLCFQFFFWMVGQSGFVIWLPSILAGSRPIGVVETGWLSAVPYVVAIAAMLAMSHFSDRTLRRKSFVWPNLAVAAAALGGSYLLGMAHFWPSFALLAVAGAAMYAPAGPFWAIVPEILPENAAGVAMALINSIGAFGAFVGVFAVGFLNGTVGSSAAIALMAGALAVSALMTLFLP